MDRLPRPLDAIEVRILGALLEKEQTTPDAYPLTENALVAACNQKSNREPVMSLSGTEVQDALGRLLEDVLVWRTPGARATRWKANLDRRWGLDPASKAVMTLLLVRGPQTPGELRSRSDRLHSFASPDEVVEVLQDLARGPEPLVTELPRAAGQKENRWAHTVGEVAVVEGATAEEGVHGGPVHRDSAQGLDAAAVPPPLREASAAPPGPRLDPDELLGRLEAIEARLGRLEEELGL